MKYVLFYESTPDFRDRVPANLTAHRAHYRQFYADKRLLLIGAFADEPAGMAMGVFPTLEDAEDFARRDPFVLQRVVAKWHVRAWDEILLPYRAPPA